MRSEVSVGALRVAAVGCPPASIDDTGQVCWSTGSEVLIDGMPVLRREGVLELDLAGGRLLVRTADAIFRYEANGAVELVATVGGSSPLGDRYAAFHDITINEEVAFTATLTDGRRTLVIRDRQVLTTGAEVGGGRVDDFLVSRLGFGVCVIANVDGRRTILHAGADLLSWSDVGLGEPLWHAPAISAELSVAAVTLPDAGGALVATAMGVGSVVLAEGDFDTPVASSSGDPFGVACVRGDELWLGVFRSRLPLEGASVIPLAVGDRTDSGEVVRSMRPIKFSASGTLLLAATLDAGTPALLTLHDLFGWYPPPMKG